MGTGGSDSNSICYTSFADHAWRGELGARFHPNGARMFDPWFGGDFAFMLVASNVTRGCPDPSADFPHGFTNQTQENHLAATLGATAGVGFRVLKIASVDLGTRASYSGFSPSTTDAHPYRPGAWYCATLGVSFYLEI